MCRVDPAERLHHWGGRQESTVAGAGARFRGALATSMLQLFSLARAVQKVSSGLPGLAGLQLSPSTKNKLNAPHLFQILDKRLKCFCCLLTRPSLALYELVMSQVTRSKS